MGPHHRTDSHYLPAMSTAHFRNSHPHHYCCRLVSQHMSQLQRRHTLTCRRFCHGPLKALTSASFHSRLPPGAPTPGPESRPAALIPDPTVPSQCGGLLALDPKMGLATLAGLYAGSLRLGRALQHAAEEPPHLSGVYYPSAFETRCPSVTWRMWWHGQASNSSRLRLHLSIVPCPRSSVCGFSDPQTTTCSWSSFLPVAKVTSLYFARFFLSTR